MSPALLLLPPPLLPSLRGPLTGCGCAIPCSVYPRLSVTALPVASPVVVLVASALAGTAVAGLAAVELFEGLFAVTFVAGCFELEALVAGRAVVVEGVLEVVAGLFAVVCLLVAEVEVAGRAVVLLLDDAGRAVVVAGLLVAVVAGRLAALLC